MQDVVGFIAAVRNIIRRHELDKPGAYRRWNWQKLGQHHDLNLNPYGCCFPLGKNVGFAEIDWVFCLTRSLRQCCHRYGDCHTALATFASQYVPFLLGLDPETDDGLNDLHTLFGAMCCLAELQTALPGQIKTERPLKLVLDRRPFI